MKKFISVTVLSAAMALCLVGCGSKDDKKDDTTVATTEATTEAANNDETTEANSTATEDKTADIASAIYNAGQFTDCAAVDSNVAINRLYLFADATTLDSSKIANATFYTNTNSSAEEIAVVECSDASYTAKVEEAFNQRKANQIEACKDYLPDEITKLNNAVIFTNGNTVVFIVAPNASAAKDAAMGCF